MNNKILVTGCRGMLGTDLTPVLAQSGFHVICVDIQEADITNLSSISKTVSDICPGLVIHTAAMTAVDACEDQPELAMAVNFTGASNVATAAALINTPIIHISTDYVFDGKHTIPYNEDDTVNPLGVYGKSKALGEHAVIQNNPRSVILRTSWLFGKHGKNFISTILKLSAANNELKIVNDQIGSPTYTVHLSHAISSVAHSLLSQHQPSYGIYHVTNSGFCSWYDFAKQILTSSGKTDVKVIPIDSAQLLTMMNYKAPRPSYSVLNTSKFHNTFDYQMPPWQEAVSEYLSSM